MYAKFGMQPKGAYIMIIHTERETYLQSAVEELIGNSRFMRSAIERKAFGCYWRMLG